MQPLPIPHSSTPQLDTRRLRRLLSSPPYFRPWRHVGPWADEKSVTSSTCDASTKRLNADFGLFRRTDGLSYSTACMYDIEEFKHQISFCFWQHAVRHSQVLHFQSVCLCVPNVVNTISSMFKVTVGSSLQGNALFGVLKINAKSW